MKYAGIEVTKVITINQPVRVAIFLGSIGPLTVSAVLPVIVMTVSFAIDAEAATCARGRIGCSRVPGHPESVGHPGAARAHRAATGCSRWSCSRLPGGRWRNGPPRV